jgi:hypothetical protein
MLGREPHRPAGDDIEDVMLMRQQRGKRDGAGPNPQGYARPGRRVTPATQPTDNATCSEGTML